MSPPFRPGSVNFATGPTLYSAPGWSAMTVTVTLPAPAEDLPGTTISAGALNIRPSGVANLVLLTSLTGAAEYSLNTVMVPEAFSSVRTTPVPETTSESAISTVWTVYASIPLEAATAGYAVNSLD